MDMVLPLGSLMIAIMLCCTKLGNWLADTAYHKIESHLDRKARERIASQPLIVHPRLRKHLGLDH